MNKGNDGQMGQPKNITFSLTLSGEEGVRINHVTTYFLHPINGFYEKGPTPYMPAVRHQY